MSVVNWSPEIIIDRGIAKFLSTVKNSLCISFEWLSKCSGNKGSLSKSYFSQYSMLLTEIHISRTSDFFVNTK